MQGTDGRPPSQSVLAADLCVPAASLRTARPRSVMLERAPSQGTPAGSVSRDEVAKPLAAGALSGPSGGGDGRLGGGRDAALTSVVSGWPPLCPTRIRGFGVRFGAMCLLGGRVIIM